MSPAVHRRPGARRDLLEAFVHIGRNSVPAARRFLEAAEQTFQRLAGMPGIGTRYDPDTPALSELRYFPVAKFPKYLVFYRPTPDGIEIVRVLHGARDLATILADEFGITGAEEEPEET